MKFQFTRLDSGNLDPGELKDFAKQFPAGKGNPTVTLGLWRASNKSFTDKTKSLAFDKKISFEEAREEMARREPVLFSLSCGAPADAGAADVGLVL